MVQIEEEVGFNDCRTDIKDIITPHENLSSDARNTCGY